MGKDVKVRFIASDEVSATLRGMRGRLKSFAVDVSKFAAGLGVVETIKQLGRAVASAVGDAAAAYPKLGASFKRVTDGFAEFRIQAGAAFLEVLQPMAPLVEQALGFLTRFVVRIPTVFDRALLSLAHVGDWFLKLPWLGREAFGGLAEAAGKFAALFGNTEIALRLQGWGAAMVQGARAARSAIDAETEAWAKSRPARDIGARAAAPGAQPKGGVSDADKARGAAEAALIRRNQGYTPQLAGGGIPLRGGLQDAQTNEEAGLGGGPTIAGAYEKGLEPLLAFNEALTQQGHIFDDIVSPAMSGTMDAIAGITQSLADSLPAHSAVAKAAQFAAKGIAKVEGGLAVIQGAKKIAEFSFPPNPAGIASGVGMVAQGVKLLSFGGGGGSGAAAGYTGAYKGSGALGGDQIGQTGRELATRGKLVVNVNGASGYERSPEYRDQITEILRQASDLREIEFTYT